MDTSTTITSCDVTLKPTTSDCSVTTMMTTVINTMLPNSFANASSINNQTGRSNLPKLDLKSAPHFVLQNSFLKASATNQVGEVPDKQPSGINSTISTSSVCESETTHPVAATTTRIVTRPSTLIPSIPQTTDSSKSHDGHQNKIPGLINTNPCSNTPTPCFWSSDLQSFSPILTPSAWKLLKSFTTTTTVSSAQQQSFLLTPTQSPLCSVFPTNPFISLQTADQLSGQLPNTNETPSIKQEDDTDSTKQPQQPDSIQAQIWFLFRNCDKVESTKVDDLTQQVHLPSAQLSVQ